MRTGRARASLLLLLLFCACGTARQTQQEVLALRGEVTALRTSLAQDRRERQAFELEARQGLGIALCRPQVRQFLENVQKECKELAGTCNTPRIRPAVQGADPAHSERFLFLMRELQHAVFYLRPGQQVVFRRRTERLERLTQGRMKQTRLLIVAHPVRTVAAPEKEALERAEVVIQYLREQLVPDEILVRWVYEFPVRRSDILEMEDLPLPGETQDLLRSVWVFRADC